MPDSQPSASPRRRFLALGGAVTLGAGAWLSLPHVRNWRASDLSYQPIEDLPGFRRSVAGEVSVGVDPFAGLRPVLQKDEAEAIAEIRADLCGALFGSEPAAAGTVPIASFSDYRCPYCRVLTQKLAAIEADSKGGIRIAWHEWPLLGDVSETAARAALAAKRQDAYAAFHKLLMRSSFMPTRSYLEDLAERLGISAERLVADMESPEVAREIAESRALAKIFRFPGTPALLVGRTVVEGAIDETTLIAIIERERTDSQLAVCAEVA